MAIMTAIVIGTMTGITTGTRPGIGQTARVRRRDYFSLAAARTALMKSGNRLKAAEYFIHSL
jgi:hypothetical protein